MFRRLQWDDALVILAWALFFSFCLVWKFNIHLMFEQYEVVQGKRPFDQVAAEKFDRLFKLIIPQNILFYSALWSVKLSFLVFFYKLGEKIRSYVIWWWCVFGATIISYIACVADIQYKCTTTVSSIAWIEAHCRKLSFVQWVNRTFYANCAADVFTDILILSIPTIILWNTRVPLRKKMVLFCVFGSTIAIMAVAIIRVTIVHSTKQGVELVWLYFWSMVEGGIATMIANVASFRQLFVASTEDVSLPTISSNPFSGKTFSAF
ncbi:hypothetical protein K469DRAFT_547487 [Zopfia rhizophila CBS 207.26]|uniref:Rhodopsin domain-containing protein n=1 Tax=Zopfia rhizophila CBS 207.26 TaxID=1314779 RepID=A0A6A6EUT3_9PEZI|nr:hypothetical protein K469DRAFT_547487 [Zopfia rhizophila CBS 207.26]